MIWIQTFSTLLLKILKKKKQKKNAKTNELLKLK